MALLFVYGTLKTGYGNNSRIMLPAGGVLQGTARMYGAVLYDLGSFPGLIITDNEDDLVHGELWEVPDKGIPALDRLEGHPNFYCRTKVVVVDNTEEDEIEVETYVWAGTPDQGMLPMAGGMWPSVSVAQGKEW